MLTALQKLKEKLKDNLKWIILNNDYELMDDLFTEALESEKQQIYDSYQDGYYHGKWGDPNWGEVYYTHNYIEKDKELPSNSKTLLEILDLENEKNVINDILDKLDKHE